MRHAETIPTPATAGEPCQTRDPGRRAAELAARVRELEEENRALTDQMVHAAAASAGIVAEAQREAAATRARVAAECYELLTVARADARDAVHEQRRQVWAEMQALSRARQDMDRQRAELDEVHHEVNERLQDLLHSIASLAGQAAASAPGSHSWHRARELEPIRPDPAEFIDTSAVEAAGYEVAPEPGQPLRPPEVGRRLAGTLFADDEDLDRAFAAFFSDDVEAEPSRGWIFNGGPRRG